MKRDNRPDTAVYAAGLPFTEQRVLSPEEVVTLGEQAHRALFRAAGWAALAILCIVGPLVAVFRLPDSALSALLPLIGIVAATLAAIASWRCRCESIARRKDQQRGIALYYASTGTDEEGTPTGHRVEMLPGSHAVWSVNGKSYERFAAFDSVEVARVPEFAAIAAQWLQPLPSSRPGGPTLLANQRELSASELTEIKRHRRKLIWNEWLLLYAFDMLYALGLWNEFSITPVETSKVLYFAGVTVGLLYFHYRPVKKLLLARRMTRDIAHGSVLIVGCSRARGKDDPDGEENGARVQMTVEILPHSGVLWTAEEKPARWRTVYWE